MKDKKLFNLFYSVFVKNYHILKNGFQMDVLFGLIYHALAILIK
jgi:hypothetical protein